MLIRFRVENFRSIKEEQELSLVASSLSEHPENVVHVERYDLDLLRTAAIYGPNASGKSTVVAALRFMRDAVEESHRLWKPDGGIPRTPFALDAVSRNAHSLFAVDILLDDVRYEYGFVVDSARVLEEWLFAYPKGKKQEWFAREASRKPEFTFSRLMPGENRAIAELTRPNSLFLSAAAQNNHQSLAPIHGWFSRLIPVGVEKRKTLELAASQLCLHDHLRAQVLEILRAADLGITGIEPIEEDLASFARRFDMESDDPRLAELPSLLTRRAGGVQFQHHAGSASDGTVLLYEQESEGTKTLFALAGAIVIVIRSGGVLVVDELDRSLHPHLALKIVSLFNDPATNPHNAQLIFNTHDTNLLDNELLRRDQIWFTEKGDDGATRLFPLTDFRARKYENLERGYLQGRYGAVPSVRTPDLRKIVEG